MTSIPKPSAFGNKENSMPIALSYLAEFEIQAAATKKFLERLPEDRLTWKPHEKSLTAGQLAYHLATVPGGVIRLSSNNPMQVPKINFHQPESRQEILDAFAESIALVREKLPALDDAAMKETLRLVAGEKELWAVKRMAFLRDIMLSHWYQHRGQFSVYLRLLDIPVPATWGPSADEPPPFMQAPEPEVAAVA
jgi:uncharacterized damage-inducible protein DinB